MTWDPPGLWASLILSVLGGLAAGVLVLAGEVTIRRGIDRRQRRKAERAISRFFGEWQRTIYDAADMPADPNNPDLGPISRPEVQFAEHRLLLLKAQNIIARWSRYLTAEQVEEVSNLVQLEELATGARRNEVEAPEQHVYEAFLQVARDIEWLDF